MRRSHVSTTHEASVILSETQRREEKKKCDTLPLGCTRLKRREASGFHVILQPSPRRCSRGVHVPAARCMPCRQWRAVRDEGLGRAGTCLLRDYITSSNCLTPPATCADTRDTSREGSLRLINAIRAPSESRTSTILGEYWFWIQEAGTDHSGIILDVLMLGAILY